MKLLNTKLLIGVLVLVGAVVSIAYATDSSARGQDCSSNSIIKCGVSSASDLKAKYNASSELQAVYGYFGWTKETIDNATWVTGYAYTDGTIKVNGKTVATNAYSMGRNANSGSGCQGTPFKIGNTTYYKGTTECRYGASDGQEMLVMLDSYGEFIGAINMSCGNPTPGTPVPVPKPVYTCDLLTKLQVTRTEFKFTATATAKNGATISGYSFDFGDGAKATSTTATVSHEYKAPGTYTATVTPNFVVSGKSVTAPVNEKCKVTVTVIGQTQACNTKTYKIEVVDNGKENTPPYTTDLTQCQTIKVCDTTVTPPVIREIYPNQMKEGYKAVDSPECQPKTPMCTVPGKEHLPVDSPDCVETKLPETGIGDIFSGVLGIGALTGASWYYAVSRRV